MNPFEMVIGIVLITSVVAIFKMKYGLHRDRDGHGVAGRDPAETQALREEVKRLKERLAVLERITIEKENSLEREIEQLRDR
jgi:uncharacterized protein YlxW (UPF0749 family)